MSTTLSDRKQTGSQRTEMTFMLKALKERYVRAQNELDTGKVAAVLENIQLSEYTPRQKIYGLEECAEALSRFRMTVFLRTVLQDHHYNKEQAAKDCDEIYAVLSKHNQIAKAEPLPRVDFNKISAQEFYETYVKTPHPVVIENFGHNVGRYQLDELVKNYGDDQVPMMKIDTGENYEGPLRELLDGHSYLANSDRLFVNNPELIDDLNSKVFAEHTRLNQISAQLFISNRGAGSPSHFGKIANTFYQLEGRKKWSLVDPAFLYLVYPVLLPGDAVNALHWQDDSDHERCPLFSFCPRYEVELSPGDILWNPYYWFHSVKNLTKSSVAVAVRWFGEPGKDFQSPLPLYDLATKICPQSADVDAYIQWMIIQQNISKRKIAWYEQVSHGRRYQAFDSSFNAQAWGLQPPDLSKGIFNH